MAPRLREHSPVPLRALPARTPCEWYLNLSSKPVGGSLLPPPPPPRRGRSSAIIAVYQAADGWGPGLWRPKISQSGINWLRLPAVATLLNFEVIRTYK